MEKCIACFSDFCSALNEIGFTIGGENGEGIFTLCDYFAPCIAWHTEERETDPWEWRMRVLDERRDIAYAKVFFGKSGYITRAWYPCFLAARRGGRGVEDCYAEGRMSHAAWKLYGLLQARGPLPLHTLKQEGGFGKESKAAFDKALTELQMGLYITICGQQCKHNGLGLEYGWSSTAFTTTEEFFGADVFREAAALTPLEAAQKIEARAREINPQADARKLRKFIFGQGSR